MVLLLCICLWKFSEGGPAVFLGGGFRCFGIWNLAVIYPHGLVRFGINNLLLDVVQNFTTHRIAERSPGVLLCRFCDGSVVSGKWVGMWRDFMI